MAQLTFVWPFGYQDFETAAVENTWTLNDSIPTPLAMTFAAPESPWLPTYWTPAEMAFNEAEAGGPAVVALLRMLMGVGQ